MYQLTATELNSRFTKGEASAVAIAEYFLQRIAHFNTSTNAFLAILEQRCLQKAEQLDKKRASGKSLGKLAGIPIAIKDNIHIQGELTTCASQFLSNYRAVFDATAVRLIEEEDGLIIGKTNLDEFAMGSSTQNSSYGVSRNPWDLQATPGGSSGGSSAAVSARLCPLALGSDTGGSIRQPAAFCGITGFKPSYGRVSRHGLVAFGSSLDQIGPLTHNVSDAALLMDVIGRHCRYDSTSIQTPAPLNLQEMRSAIAGSVIGVPWRFLEGLPKETRTNFDHALEIYKNLGCSIVEVDLDLLKYSIAIYYILATAEASTNLARFDGVRYGKRSTLAKNIDEIFDLSRAEGFGREVKRRILLGTYVLSSGFQEAYYRKAQKMRTLIIELFHQAFKKCTIIATPSTPTSAFPIGGISNPLQMYLQDIYTVPANLAGLPAVAVPSGFCSQGKPLSLHLIAPMLQDHRALRFAYQFEQATSYHKQISPLFNKDAK